MIIDNSHAVIRDRKMMYLMAISLTIIIPCFFFIDIFEEPVLGIPREYYVIAVCTIYVLINIYRFLLSLNYIYYNDQGGKIVLKYYTLRPFIQKRKNIEIPIGSLVKYKIIRKIAGIKKSLVLYQRINNKIAKYPPISLSELKKTEFDNLISALNTVISAVN